MRDLMLSCARQNIIIRERGVGRVFIKASPSAKRGFRCTVDEARGLAAHGPERLTVVAMAMGLRLVKS